MEAIFITLTVVLGTLSVLLLFKLGRDAKEIERLKTTEVERTELRHALSTSEAKYELLERASAQDREDLREVRADKDDAQQGAVRLASELKAMTDKFEESKVLRDEATQRAREAHEKAEELKVKLSAAEAERQAANDKLAKQKQEIEVLHAQTVLQFEKVANAIMEEKATKFTQANRAELDTLLTPLRENLTDFKKQVEEVYGKESRERFSLEKEIKQLRELNERLSTEASNLSKALTTNTKVQGDWGQTILERILEISGLQKGRQYFVQETLRGDDGKPLLNEDGRRMQPDVVIRYPDDRVVIVDSKVSLNAFNRACNAEEEVNAQAEARAHVQSIKKHIDDLASKKYADKEPALDFVMLFVPIEPAYVLAMQTDPEIWEYAFNKRIFLTSPTNLIVAMKMIADLWRRDAQAKNYQAIVDRGGKLYDKFCGLVEAVVDMGKALRSLEGSYLDTLSKLNDGPGNLLRQVQQLKSLGASAKKSLPDQILEPQLKLSTGGPVPQIDRAEITTETEGGE